MADREQAIPIIRTKLHRPLVTADLVCRTGLHAKLDAGRRLPLTLVSAPAGYGKSTLLSHWLEGCDGRSAWLSLDEADSDTREFCSYFVAAVRTVFPDACRETLDVLGSGELPPISVLSSYLLNDLDQIDESFVLVLDDYHHVHKPAVHKLLDDLLKYPPRPFHLVLTTRHDPPISLTSLRARGWLTEIRQDDLRFSKSEVKAVLEQMAGISVSDSALTHLEREMEGWIVGLHLVGLLLRNQRDPEAFLSGLKGGFQQVQDYLLEEVLARQPAAVQDGMTKVSLLDRFCAPLVEALCFPSGDTAAAAMTGEGLIRAVNAANLFIIPLDVRGKWFRYHHLFRDLLRSQLERHHTPNEIAVLYGRVSEWFESQGLIMESIEHAQAAGDVVRAAEIVEAYRHDELTADRWYVVERWLAMLPADIKQRRPKLLAAEAWTVYFRLQVSRMSLILAQIESLLDGQTVDPTLSAELAFFRGYLHYWEGRAEESRACLEESLSLVAGKEPYVESQVELHLGLARCMGGHKEGAIQALEDRIRAFAVPEGQFLAHMIATLTFIHLICGDLLQARVQSKRMNLVAEKSGISSTAAWSSYLRACSHLHAGELETAAQHFALAAERRYVLDTMAAVDALAGLALSRQLLQREEEATETLDMVLEYAGETNDSHCLSVAESCRARLSVLRGDLSAASPWAQSASGAPEPAELFMWLEVPAITRARVLIACGTPEYLDKAIALLGEIRQVSDACRFTCQTIEVLVLQCLSLEKQGRTDEALAALKEAVALVEPGGWVRPFVELGQPMAELLRRLRTQNVAVEFVDRLLAAFPEGQPEAATEASGVESILSSVSESNRRIAGGQAHAGSQAADAATGSASVVEPLTNRELDVLQLLAERLYDKEIAKSLSISVHTVRSHVKHIFEKLHVAGRRQAVLKAEELGLLKNS